MAIRCRDNELLYFGKVDEDAQYIPKRAGVINPETEYVLKRFGVAPPGYMPDVRRQVQDISIRRVNGIHRNLSLKQAW